MHLFDKRILFSLSCILLMSFCTRAAAELDTSRNTLINYNKRIAYKLAVASDCAYRLEGLPKEKESVHECLKKSGIDEYRNLKKHDVFPWRAPKNRKQCNNEGVDAYILINTDNALILAIRGTLPPIFYDSKSDDNFLRDWKNNIHFTLLNSKQIITNYHIGFMESWECIKESLYKGNSKRFLDTHLSDQKNFYITGHSKGGAIAIIAAIKSLEGGLNWPIQKQPSAIYTFSAPRPFTNNKTRDYVEKYGNDLKQLLWRLEYKNDLVPLLPPEKNFYDHYIAKNEFTSLMYHFAPLPKVSDLFISYDSFGLGRLFYVDQDNKLIEIRDVDHNQVNQDKRIKSIFSTYDPLNLIKNDLAELTTYPSFNMMKFRPRFCYEIVNNHQAHTSFLKKLVIEKDPIDPAEEIPSEWDKFCTMKSISDSGKTDFIKRVYQLIGGLEAFCQFDLYNEYKVVIGLC